MVASSGISPHGMVQNSQGQASSSGWRVFRSVLAVPDLGWKWQNPSTKTLEVTPAIAQEPQGVKLLTLIINCYVGG